MTLRNRTVGRMPQEKRKMPMKRCFAAAVVLLALCMVLAGCKGKKKTEVTSTAPSAAVEATPVPTPTLPPY